MTAPFSLTGYPSAVILYDAFTMYLRTFFSKRLRESSAGGKRDAGVTQLLSKDKWGLPYNMQIHSKKMLSFASFPRLYWFVILDVSLLTWLELKRAAPL